MKKALPLALGAVGLITLILVSVSHSFDIKAAAGHVVISQVQIAGTTSSDDFIELYNPTSSAVDLTGFRLVKRTSGGTTDSSIKAFDSGTTISSHGYYLWANSGIAASTSADASTSATIAADNGVALRNGPTDSGTIVDSVAWGTATNAFVEGSPFSTNPQAGSSIERKVDDTGGHGTDTDNNANDFELVDISNPRNSTTVVATPSPSATPTATPTESPSPSPTASESPTPTPTASATPTATASPTSVPTETPTPSGFPFPFKPLVFSCRVNYVTMNFGWFILSLPQIFCGWNL